MAEKLDNIDKEIERELHDLSLDELSTSDTDADHSLPSSPAKDNCSGVLDDYLQLMNKTHSDLDLLHNQSRDFLKLTEKAKLDNTLMNKLKSELDSEATTKEELDDRDYVDKQETVIVTSANTPQSLSQCEQITKDEQSSSYTVLSTSERASVQHAVSYSTSFQVPQYHCDQHVNTEAILHYLEEERKEKELLAEEQKNINEKLKAIEKEQWQCFEKAKRAEAQFKEEKLQKQVKAATVLQSFWRRFRVWSTYQPKLRLLKELRLRKKSEQKAERLKEMCRAAIIIQKYWRGYKIWLIYQPKLKLLKEMRMKRISEEKLKLAEEFKERSKAAMIIQKHWRGYKVWIAYCQRLKILKEERLRKISLERIKLNEATLVLQKHWRRCKVQILYGAKLKELKQKRILSKLKKINEKRRKYHSVSSEGKVSLSSSENTVVDTTLSSTSSNTAQNHNDQVNNISDNAMMKDDTHDVIIAQGTSGGDNESDNVTKVAGVMRLCGSPVRMNDSIKEEIDKLLQEEGSRNTKVESTERSSKLLKIQSNFETGLLNLQNPDKQSSVRRHSSTSPISNNSLSASSSSAVFASPSASKTMCRTSGVLEESDEDNDNDDITKELKMLDAIVDSKHKEELVAKKSRERMLKAYSIEKGSMATLGGTKRSLIDYATAEMSPMVWHELIEERRKKWLLNHSLWK